MTTTNPVAGWLNEAELVHHRMRSLHRERVETIQKDKFHVRLSDPTRLMLHLIPEDAVRAQNSLTAPDSSWAALASASWSLAPRSKRRSWLSGLATSTGST